MRSILSNRIQAVQDPIIPIVGQLIKQHPGTISLGQGVVWYGPPSTIQPELEEFHKHSENHLYSPVDGISPLLAAIESKLQIDNRVMLNGRRRIVVTSGGNLAFSNAVFAIADPGDEFILSVPFYFNHEMAITMANCKAVLVYSDKNYQLDLAALEAAITPKTRAIVTVSPGNPTGVVLTEDSLMAVNNLCRDKGIYHIHDEAYEYFHYAGSRQFSPASIPSSEAHTISLYSLSKSYGFASWRIGYMVIPSELFDAVLKIQDTQLICAPVISQFAAVGAMRSGKSWCQQQQTPIAQSREIVINALDEISNICSYPRSNGAFYFYLKIDTDISDLELCKKLITEHGVAAIPGTTFGSDDGSYLRIAYGSMTPDSASEGINRFVAGIKKIVG